MYNIMYSKVKEKCAPKTFITRKDLFTILGRIYHVPSHMRYDIVEEMIKLELLRWDKRDYLEIL